jgi:hypothetical protein
MGQPLRMWVGSFKSFIIGFQTSVIMVESARLLFSERMV